MRARYAPLTALLVAVAAVVACSSSSSPPPHPANVVDCQPSPPSSVTGPHCPGICLQHDHCDDAGPVCPAGFQSLGPYGCPNSATCCFLGTDGGAEGGSPDAGSDGSDGSDGAAADGAADGAADSTSD